MDPIQLQRAFVNAIFRFSEVEMEKQANDPYLKPENRWTREEAYTATLRTLNLGWIWFDGQEIHAQEFVAVKPDAALAYLTEGKQWTDDDVMERL